MKVDERNIEVIDDVMVKILREKTPQQRLVIACDMWASARRCIENHLRADHPDWDESMVQKEVARRLSHGTV